MNNKKARRSRRTFSVGDSLQLLVLAVTAGLATLLASLLAQLIAALLLLTGRRLIAGVNFLGELPVKLRQAAPLTDYPRSPRQTYELV